jgi:hypothetical protein
MTLSTAVANPKQLLSFISYCPACSIWRLRPITPGRARPSRNKRPASTLVSSTAINATKSIPPRNRDLYQALNELKKKAYGQVNLSRLQLAIQGLESERPTTRIALLGLNGPATARRLARLLLADSSKPQQEWEVRLAEDEGQKQGLVIRYGSPRNEALQAPRSALSELLVPAPVLQSQGIEILVSAVNAPDQSATNKEGTPSDALLSPTVATPASADGRQSLIRQPVHRTMLVANGFDQFLSSAELLARTTFGSDTEKRLVEVVLNLNGKAESSDTKAISVDATRAEKGLQAVREALGKAPEYEKAWIESGMPALSRWLACPSVKSSGKLLRPLRDLISSVLEAASANIASQAKEAELRARSNALTGASRILLENAISAFSQQGHAELQSGLAAGNCSGEWMTCHWLSRIW